LEAIRNIFDFSDFPRSDLLIATFVAAVLLVFPAFPHSSFAMSTMIQFLMFSLYALGWNTIGGYGGQVDLGQAQYLGIGAFTTAVMMIRWNAPFWVSMPVGVLFAVTWSFCIGYPLFRLKGHYFAIATIATSLVLKDIFEVWPFVGSARGLAIPIMRYLSPDFSHLVLKDDTYYFYVILCFFFIGIFLSTGSANPAWGFNSGASKTTRTWPGLWESTCAGPKSRRMPLPPPLSVPWDPFTCAISKTSNPKTP
jgi:branched-chain amino acid transport system permease protein